MSAHRILLIDDHAMFRSGLAVLLSMSIANLEVTEADSVVEYLQLANNSPDLVLLDITLRGLNGIDCIELLRRRWPNAPIVMVSSDAAPATVKQAMARGATAFVSKEKSAENILSVVKDLLFPQVLNLESVSAAPTSEVRLTPRQLEVLVLLCKGLPNKAIGRKLDLSENTVRWHVQAILAVLKVSNRSEASYAARGMGLVN